MNERTKSRNLTPFQILLSGRRISDPRQRVGSKTGLHREVQAQGFDGLGKEHGVETLGEDIGKLPIGRDVDHVDLSVVDPFADCKVASRDVLGPG